jgi:hypothetical protein
MFESYTSSKSFPAVPSWLRIGIACVMFADAGFHAWNRHLWFEWAPWLCYGVFFLLVPFRKWDEALATYFGKRRTIACFVLLITGMVVFTYSLFVSTR